MLNSLSKFLPDAQVGASNTPKGQNHPGAPGLQKVDGGLFGGNQATLGIWAIGALGRDDQR